MITINLLASEHRKKTVRQFRLPPWPYLKIAGMVMAALVVLELLLGALFIQKHSRASALNQDLRALSPHLARLNALKAELRRTQTRSTELEQAERRPLYWTHLLESLSQSVTDDIWLTELDYSAKQDAAEKAVKPRGRFAKRLLGMEGEPKGGEKKEGLKSAAPGAQVLIVIRGSAPASGEGTGDIGKFIQSLKDNPLFQKITSEIALEKIDRKIGPLGPFFEFTVSCVMNSEFAQEAP